MTSSASTSHEEEGHTLTSLPKTWRFTQSLPPDPQFPTPAASHKAPRDKLGPRLVRGALFTWVRPEEQEDPELLAVSPAALRDLGIKPSEAKTEDFRQTAAGNVLWGWDEGRGRLADDGSPGVGVVEPATNNAGYPWAQCYGGYQFGQWAGQLGDGRAVSLFEVPLARPTPNGGTSYEVQLKGAGTTPYSRFADGRAVLRSSIREFVVSEALNALGIPSTRALALTLLPKVLVHRERLEPGAIVVRFAETWLRLGTFDLLRARGDRPLTQQLATYAAETVFGGWENLPGRLEDPTDETAVLRPPRGIPRDTVEGLPDGPENRFARLYREVVRRNAATVARWQAYGFMNGVLNTDNTSVLGLSLDFGPFAFLDHFDPAYTPNHDDHLLRYSYKNQPSIVWWNLVRFGEALGELLAAGDRVDDPRFAAEGILGLAKADAGAGTPAEGDGAAASGVPPPPPSSDDSSKEQPTPEAVEKAATALASQAETAILRAGEEYKTLFLAEYKRLFLARLGLPPPATQSEDETTETADDATGMDPLVSGLLDVLEQLELDFHLFFRRLSAVRLADLETEEDRVRAADRFFYKEGLTVPIGEGDGRKKVAVWLAQWRERVLATENRDDDKRIPAMKAVNPNFVPRGWILDEVIRRVEQDGERDVLRRVMHLALHPFADGWHGQTFDGQMYEGDAAEEARWTQDVPQTKRALQCSCSS